MFKSRSEVCTFRHEPSGDHVVQSSFDVTFGHDWRWSTGIDAIQIGQRRLGFSHFALHQISVLATQFVEFCTLQFSIYFSVFRLGALLQQTILVQDSPSGSLIEDIS